MQRERPTSGLRSFVAKANPRFVFYKHCELLADVLEKVASGEIKRLMVFLPPRHSKSEMVSRLFSAYYLRRNPHHFVGINSYAADLAFTLSRAARANYIETGGEIKQDASAVKHWETPEGGGMWSAGVGGPITGKGAHCFPADTLITTDAGVMRIDELCALQNRPKVLSYNHLTGVCEWHNVRAVSQRISYDGLYELRTKNGRTVQATPDHRIFVEGSGYAELRTLQRSEQLIVSSVLSGIEAAEDGRFNVCELRQRVSEASLSARKILKVAMRGVLLFKAMLQSPSRNKECSEMSVRKLDRDEKEPLLFASLLSRERQKVSATRVSGLSNDVSRNQLSNGVLQQTLRRQSPFSTDDWQGQFSLQNRNELLKVVSRNEAPDYGARSVAMCGVSLSDVNPPHGQWTASYDLSGSSYRRTPPEQYPAKSDCVVRNLPSSSPSFSGDSVSVVRRTRKGSVEVYDLDVAGNHNFFANEILVHNCLIIDDPLKNAEEANSEVIREKHKEWYNTTFYSRREPNASIILIQTRWHEDDLAGWLLSEESNSPENWHIVCLPALSDDPQTFPETCTVEPDFRKEHGIALCPERYDEADHLKTKAKGERNFEALYQQHPTAKQGYFFDVTKLEIVDAAPVEAKRVRGWDKAATPGDGDYTASTRIAKNGIFYIEDVTRGQWDTSSRDKHIRQTAELDTRSVKQMGEQEPGSGGKESAENFIRLLAGFSVAVERSTANKQERADPFSSQVNAGNVKLVRGDWNKSFIEELRQFPFGKHDDQVDSASLAFNELNGGGFFEIDSYRF